MKKKKTVCVLEKRDILAIHEWCLSAPALTEHTSLPAGDINPEPLCSDSTFSKIGLVWLHVFRSVKIKSHLCLITS